MKRLQTEPLKSETKLRVVCSREHTRKCKQQVAERSRLRWSDCESEAVDRPVTGAGATSYAVFMYLASCSKFCNTDRDLIADVALVFGRNQAGFGSAFLFLSQSRRGLCDSSRAAAAVFWCLSLRHFLRGVALQVLETRVERLLRRHSTFLTFQSPSSLSRVSPTPFKSPRRCS